MDNKYEYYILQAPKMVGDGAEINLVFVDRNHLACDKQLSYLEKNGYKRVAFIESTMPQSMIQRGMSYHERKKINRMNEILLTLKKILKDYM